MKKPITFISRSSRSQMFFKIGILRISSNFTRKNLCWRLQHKCFPVKFATSLRIPFYRTPPVAASVSPSLLQLMRSRDCCLRRLFSLFTTLLLGNQKEYSRLLSAYVQLTHSFPMHPFSTPWKHQKTLRFSDVFRV